MDRRTFLAGTGAILLAAPLAAAEAQQTGKVYRIAFISGTSPGSSPATDAFGQGLRELGYIEGRNITIEWRWGRGETERFAEFAAEMVKLQVDLIVAGNEAAGRAAQEATKTIPIVVGLMGDPVGSGLVATLARPGGNITGLTSQGPDTTAKRLQLLREALPTVSRVAVLADTNDASYRLAISEAEVAARGLGMQLQLQEVRSPGEFKGMFATIARQGARAGFTIGGPVLYANRAQLAQTALKSHLPMMCGVREHVEAGCLMSYAASLTGMFHRAAYFVDKILKGAKPADLPVEQPTKFELVINLKTAKALGLTIPPSLLLRADEVIQ